MKTKEVQTEMSNVNISYVDLNTAKTRERVHEVLDSKSETEQAGYIPPQQQIENMILAGRRLDESRKALYDFDSEDEIDEAAYDPTRSGNYDLSDASQQQYEVNARLRDQASKASQAVQEPSGDVQNDKAGGNEPPPPQGA